MATLSTTYVDRDEASKILNVSTRTVDRYIRKFKFKTRKDGRRVLIKRKDVDQIIQDQIGQYVELKNENLKEAKQEKKADIAVKDIKVESVNKKSEKTAKNEKDEKVFQNLYNETKKELKEKQERLDAATYRVGQLEAQVESMVPMLDYTRKEKELKEAKNTIEQKEVEKLKAVNQMENKLRRERIAKWIYLSLVGTLLVVEPLLFLWWAFA